MPKTGFCVFYERQTNLYYLNASDGDHPKRPNFGSPAGYETVLKYKASYDLDILKQFVRQQIKAGALYKYQFDTDIVQDALFLSDTFQTRVFCAYHDDEDTDCVALCNKGFLEKLCFSAASSDESESEADYFEIIYRQGEMPRLELEQNTFQGYDSLYQREFLSYFGKPAPDLSSFGQPKPPQHTLKPTDLARLYGQFKRVDFEENRTSPALEKYYGILDMTLKIILIPFLVMAVLVMSIRDDLLHRKGRSK